MKKNLESYEQLTLGRVISFDGFGLNNYRGITTLKVLAFISDRTGDITRRQAECREKGSSNGSNRRENDFKNTFCFLAHSSTFLIRRQKYNIFLTYAREREIFFTFYVIFRIWNTKKYDLAGDVRRIMAGNAPQRVKPSEVPDTRPIHAAMIWRGYGLILARIWEGLSEVMG